MTETPIKTEAMEPIVTIETGYAHAHYVLRLYVTGTTLKSARAIVNIRKICEDHLDGHYELEIVDLSRTPSRAKDEQIFAAPTLIKHLPLPLRRFIGDMSQTDGLLHGLGLLEAIAASPPAKGP